MFKRILTGLVGGHHADAVIDASVELATLHRAKITGVTALKVAEAERIGPRPLGAAHAAQQLREHRVKLSNERIEDCLATFEQRCRASGTPYSVKREQRDEPYDFLVSRARYHDVTVLSLKSILDYNIHGSNDSEASKTIAKLITAGVRPIVAVPERWRTIRRVFIAYSGSVQSASTLRQFTQLRAFGDLEAIRLATFEVEAPRGKRLLHHARNYLRSHGFECEPAYFPAKARENLLREAQAFRADAIVLGNSAGSLLRRRLLGETSLNTIRDSEIPLFLSQ